MAVPLHLCVKDTCITRGSTTLAGYQEGHIVKIMFDAIGYQPELISTDPSIVIIQNGKTIPRYKDLDTFIKVLEQNYPHPKNREFWTLIYEMRISFYAMHGHYYARRSKWRKYISMASYIPATKVSALFTSECT